MQKPDWLNEEILRRFTEPGDTVVDAFGCSASMGTACEKMGRNWIYSESNEHNYKLGKENMERYFLGQQVKKVG
jgi:DNA modification methylase